MFRFGVECLHNYYNIFLTIVYKAQHKRIAVRIVHEGSLPDGAVFRADRSKLVQVLRNFLSNALKFSKPNSEIDVIIQYDEALTPRSVTTKKELASQFSCGAGHCFGLHRRNLKIYDEASNYSDVSTYHIASNMPYCTVKVRDKGPGISKVPPCAY